MEKIKNFIKFIKEMYKNPRGRGILFFGFYFIFFLVLIIIIRIGASSTSTIKNTNNDSVSMVELGNNYKFNYNVLVDGETYNYIGEKANNHKSFVYKDVEYYYDSSYYVRENDDLKYVDNPYVYNELLNMDNLNKIISLASKLSTTNYEDGRVEYKYLISSNTIINKLEDKETDIDDIPNSIIIGYIDENVNKIEIDLSSYGKYKNICQETFKIELDLSDFNEVVIEDK